MKKYDLLVIGGGSGGVATANRAASYGAKVALFEEKKMGGTCVNVGCVPKKIMWSAASLQHSLEDSINYGFNTQFNSLDWMQLKSNRDAYISKLNSGYEKGLTGNGVSLIRSHASFVENNIVSQQKNYNTSFCELLTDSTHKSIAIPVMYSAWQFLQNYESNKIVREIIGKQRFVFGGHKLSELKSL